MAVKLRPKGPRMALISREIALLLSKMSFPPRAVHTPGVAHVLADRLSRLLAEDEHLLQEHPAVQGAIKETCPARNKSWYRTISHYPSRNK